MLSPMGGGFGLGRLGRVGSGQRSPYAAYALAEDFLTSQYWAGGTQYSPLSSVPGYSYTRSGTASYVNASGGIETFAANVPPIVTGKGYMAYGALTNSLLQSQNFSTADWVAGAASITTDTVAAPDGTLTADTLTDNTATSEHRIYQSPASSVSGTASVFLQMGTCRYASLSTGVAAPGYAVFDLQAGVVASFVSGVGITAANIVACGGGWYRCNISGGNLNFVVFNMGDTAAHAIPETSWTGTGTNTLHLWQAQVIPGTFPDGGPIIATTTAAASIGTSALSVTINPYTTDQDFIFWAVVTFAAPVSSSKSNILAILGSEAGPYINLQREFSSGKLKVGISSGGGDAFSGATLVGTGRAAILYRRRAGKDTCAIKSGTVTIGTESAVNTFAAVTSRLAESFTSNETDGVIEGVFARTGTFSDADITAILGAA